MPNFIKQIGMQADPTKVPEMYHVNSDIATFKVLGTPNTSLTIDNDYKYTVVELNNKEAQGLSLKIPQMQSEQELYVFIINPYNIDIGITIDDSPMSSGTYYTGAGKSFDVQANSTMEVSIVKLDSRSGSTVSSYYFVRVA